MLGRLWAMIRLQLSSTESLKEWHFCNTGMNGVSRYVAVFFDEGKVFAMKPYSVLMKGVEFPGCEEFIKRGGTIGSQKSLESIGLGLIRVSSLSRFYYRVRGCVSRNISTKWQLHRICYRVKYSRYASPVTL